MASVTLVLFHFLARCSSAFAQKRTFTLWQDLVVGWVLCSGRHSITGILRALGDTTTRAHDAYHRFFREGAYDLDALWQLLTCWLVEKLYRSAWTIYLDIDDTLFHRVGRKVDGAGSYRDAVRSTKNKVVFAHGLNLLVVTLRVVPPWSGVPLGLPINLRLHRKRGPTLLELATDMVRQIRSWLPKSRIFLCGDGAYASLGDDRFSQVIFTSRVRRDAALYAPPPLRTGKRGRPAKKGHRLLSPEQMSLQSDLPWLEVSASIRGKSRTLLVHTKRVIWYSLCKEREILLVIVRDPLGKQPDDYFFTTDVTLHAVAVVECYGGRWSIECSFRDIKQLLGGEHPQCWKGQGPQRTAAFACALYSIIWCWYLTAYQQHPLRKICAWFPKKQTPSFADALSTLRAQLWRDRINARSDQSVEQQKILIELLVQELANAA